MVRIKKGDEVIVIAGRDKASAARCCAALTPARVVEGVNQGEKKHQRPNPMKGVTGGIVDSKSDPCLNVALSIRHQKGRRAGIKALRDGRRVRVFKANGEQWTSDHGQRQRREVAEADRKAQAGAKGGAAAEGRPRRSSGRKGRKGFAAAPDRPGPAAARGRRRGSPSITARRWCRI